MWPNHSGSVGPVLAGTNVATMDPKPYVLPPPATPPRRPPKRSNELVGVHFESPKRRRPIRKDSAIVVRPGLAQREQELSARLNILLGKHQDPAPSIDEDPQFTDPVDYAADVLGDNKLAEVSPQLTVPDVLDSAPVSSTDEKQSPSRSSVPNETAQRIYHNWLALIPTLEDEYLSYMQRAQGRLGRPLQYEPHRCISRRCVTKAWPVQCLYADCTF